MIDCAKCQNDDTKFANSRGRGIAFFFIPRMKRLVETESKPCNKKSANRYGNLLNCENVHRLVESSKRYYKGSAYRPEIVTASPLISISRNVEWVPDYAKRQFNVIGSFQLFDGVLRLPCARIHQLKLQKYAIKNCRTLESYDTAVCHNSLRHRNSVLTNFLIAGGVVVLLSVLR